jgi:hypothetical protein
MVIYKIRIIINKINLMIIFKIRIIINNKIFKINNKPKIETN